MKNLNNNQKTLGIYERFGSIIQMKNFNTTKKGIYDKSIENSR